MMWKYAELIYFQASANIKSQVVRSYIGPLWWILEPLMTMVAYYMVFELLLSRGGEDYIFNLLIGVTVWGWFNAVIMQCAQSMHRGAALMNQTNIGKIFFPLVDIVDVAFKQIFIGCVLLLLIAYFKGVSLTWWLLPVLFFESMLIGSAVALFFSAVVPFIPDIYQLLSMAMRVLMFCSGVFYTADAISPEMRGWFLLNPFANIIDQFRAVMLKGELPNFSAILLVGGVAICVIGLTIMFIRKNDKAYPRLVMQ